MESIGQKLKTAREAKGFTIEQVARDTHIAKRFILSLEEENFDAFPGDTYILGFLRNYSDHLGLDPVEMITLYKNLKIQEQPAPIEELLERRSPKPYIAAGAVILLVVLLAAGAYFFFKSRGESAGRAEAPPAASQYIFQDAALEQPFTQGDEILVNRDGTSYKIRIDRIGSTVIVLGPVDKLNLKEGEEGFIELTPKGETLKVFCRSIRRGEIPPKAVLLFDKYIRTAEADSAAPSTIAAALPEPAGGISPPVGATNEPSRIRRTQVILESAARNPFTIEVEFRGYCLFRYMTDNQNREERYFRRGETFRTDVRGEIRLWYSNSGSLRARIAGKEIEFGKPGEVGASVIQWVRSETDGNFRLELVPMY